MSIVPRLSHFVNLIGMQKGSADTEYTEYRETDGFDERVECVCLLF